MSANIVFFLFELSYFFWSPTAQNLKKIYLKNLKKFSSTDSYFYYFCCEKLELQNLLNL